MPVLTNVFRRGGVFYFRARVPVEFRQRLGRNELWRSLKTTDTAEARRRGGVVHALTEALWSGLQRAMNESEAQALVSAWLKAKLDDDREMRRQYTWDHMVLQQWVYDDEFGEAATRRAANDQSVAVRHVNELFAVQGIAATEAEQDMATRMMVRAHAELFEALKARSRTGWRPWLDDDPAADLVATPPISCQSYIASVADTLYTIDDMLTSQASVKKHILGVCLDPTISVIQISDVVRKELADHPESRQYRAADEVYIALRQAFPCSVTQPR